MSTCLKVITIWDRGIFPYPEHGCRTHSEPLYLCIILCFFYLFSPKIFFQLQSYWSLSCDHGLHCINSIVLQRSVGQSGGRGRKPSPECNTQCTHKWLKTSRYTYFWFSPYVRENRRGKFVPEGVFAT